MLQVVTASVVKTLKYKIRVYSNVCCAWSYVHTAFAPAAHSGSENLISSQMGPSNDL